MRKKVDDILNLVDSLDGFAYRFTYDSDKDGIRVYNNHRVELNPEQADYLIQGLTNFYGSFNEVQRLDLKKRQIEKELIKRASWYGSLVEKKEFRKNLKRHWTFYCTVCRGKVSSSSHIAWWTINNQSSNMLGSNRGLEKCCSESCANLLATEIIHQARIEAYKENGLKLL